MTRKTVGIIVAPLVAPMVWMPLMFVARLVSGYPLELARNMSGYGSWGAFVEMLIFVPVTFVPLAFGVMFLLGLPFANRLIQKDRTKLRDFVKAGVSIGLILSAISLFTLIGASSAPAPSDISPTSDTFALAMALIATSVCCAITYWIVAVKNLRAV